MESYQQNSMSNDLTKTKPRLYFTNWIYTVGLLDNYCPHWRPQWTLTFWVNATFWESYQQNPMSNDLTKTKPRLFYKYVF